MLERSKLIDAKTLNQRGGVNNCCKHKSWEKFIHNDKMLSLLHLTSNLPIFSLNGVVNKVRTYNKMGGKHASKDLVLIRNTLSKYNRKCFAF